MLYIQTFIWFERFNLSLQHNFSPNRIPIIMKLQQLVAALDAQVVKGDIIGAFQKYAADNCVTLSNDQDKTHSKTQKLEILGWFFKNIATTNRIELLATKVGDNVTESQFAFDFTNRQGQQMAFDEVIRRTWKNDLVVEEVYLLGETIDNSAPQTTATAAPKASKTAAEPKADKKPATKSAKATATVQSDDLVIIEGIGPKIAELLNAAGITTFAQLAAQKPAAIKSILEAAGKRYQMHEPATWPKQAALARDGKTAELTKLQGELKAGK